MSAAPAMLAALAMAAATAHAATSDTDSLLRSLIGKDQATVEQRVGPPDESESNGLQTFLHYRTFESHRTSSRPDPFGYSQGYSGSLGFRGKASFDCVTTLVITDGTLRAYTRRGSDCR